MTWQDLLGTEEVTLPWIGGRMLRVGPRVWKLEGKLPPEHGWYVFTTHARTAKLARPHVNSTAGGMELRPAPWGQVHPPPVQGFLVGDHIVPDDVQLARAWCPRCGTPVGDRFLAQACARCHVPAVAIEKVHLLEPLERFSRVLAARAWEGGPLFFASQLMPVGPEGEVQAALEDGKTDLSHVKGVPPALEAAFRFEVHQRAVAEAARQAAAAEAARLAQERAEAERREAIREQLGSADGRRALAQYDFKAAATAALAVGGATYLDHRAAQKRGDEMVVRFRFINRRFECTCSATTLRIIDSGICLVDHNTDERGDTRFTLESLPAVIREAERDHRLVVFRHA